MTIFAASAVLLALNHSDPDVRRERCHVFADLLENFHVEPVYDDDIFLGIVDALPPPLATAAVA